MVFLYCLLGILALMGGCAVAEDIVESIKKGWKE